MPSPRQKNRFSRKSPAPILILTLLIAAGTVLYVGKDYFSTKFLKSQVTSPPVTGSDFLGHWKFDETEGTLIKDSLGKQTDIDISGKGSLSAGKFGNAINVGTQVIGFNSLQGISDIIQIQPANF